MCDGTKCAGRCTIPSSAFPCDGDEDCRGPWIDFNLTAGFGYGSIAADSMTFDGTCDTGSGTCRCTGPQDCADPDLLNAEQECPQMAARMFASWAPHATTRWYTEMRRRAEVLKSPTTGVKPTLIFGTMPGPVAPMCYALHQADGGYRQSNLLVKSTLPLVADPALAIDRLQKTISASGSERGHSDWIHLDQPGAEESGHAYRDVKRTLNSCIKSTGAIQGYCLLPTGSYKTCSVNGDCNGAAAGTCSGGFCICDGSSQCPSADCMVKVCASGTDCPATTDTCNVEP